MVKVVMFDNVGKKRKSFETKVGFFNSPDFLASFDFGSGEKIVGLLSN